MTLPSEVNLLTDADINDLSEKGLTIVIPVSKSKNFPLVEKLSTMMTSMRGNVNGRDVLICIANLSLPRECDLAMNIIDIASQWKGFSVIAKRVTLSSFSYYQVLPCIIDAFQCVNYKAHCHTRVGNSSFLRAYSLRPLEQVSKKEAAVILPCKLASHGFYDPLIDASVTEQYQAHAVSRGVHWCPFFDASLIKINDIAINDINERSEKIIHPESGQRRIQDKKPT